jgi:penicillin-binding protein 1C
VRSARTLLLAAALLFGAALARDGVGVWVAATELPPLVPETSVEMRDRSGVLLRAYTVEDGRYRLGADPAAVDPLYLAMLLAYEDQRFPDHAGVDPLAILRAAGQSLRAGRVVSGGSTLTMQVARLLENSGTGAWAGKLRQVRLALALERRLTKAQVLELYLTLAPFGGNIEGVRAGALTWLGRAPARLTPAQAALLVALPQSPETRRPDRFPEAARQARDRVLARAAAAGVIDAETLESARRAPVPDLRRPFPALATHLTDRVAAARPWPLRHDLSLDAGLQARLEGLAAEAARTTGPQVSAAILVVETATGLIRASVGSAGLEDGARQGFVDMTQAVRSPGSTLKPLVYGLAFDAGLAHPETLIEDRPTAFGTYVPQNFDKTWRGTLSLRDALQASLNIPAVKLTEALGPANLTAAMRRAGMEPRLPGGVPGLAVALGGVGVTLEELVGLYAGIAAGGQAVRPGWDAASAATGGTRIMGEVAAWQVGDVLRGVPPPPHAARGLAFKTGTSYGHRDAWAIGYDGAHVVGVWLGRPDGTPVPGAFGADVAAPLLFEVFGAVTPRFVPAPPPPPATLTVATADLPPPLRQFRSRDAALQPERRVEIAFPPQGAVLAPMPGGLPVKLRGGVPPFAVLADGVPVATGVMRRETALQDAGPGFVTLTVIDAEGAVGRVSVEVRP